MLVICDNAAKITWIITGWPGSVHDNQLSSKSKILLDRDNFSIRRRLHTCEKSVKIKHKLKFLCSYTNTLGLDKNKNIRLIIN